MSERYTIQKLDQFLVIDNHIGDDIARFDTYDEALDHIGILDPDLSDNCDEDYFLIWTFVAEYYVRIKTTISEHKRLNETHCHELSNNLGTLTWHGLGHVVYCDVQTEKFTYYFRIDSKVHFLFMTSRSEDVLATLHNTRGNIWYTLHP